MSRLQAALHARAVVLAAVPTLALVTFVALVATGFGRSGRAVTAAHTARSSSLMSVVSGPVGATSATAQPGVKLTFLTGNSTVGPGHYSQLKGTCPANYPHPISGFFDSNSNNVALAASRPDPATPKSRAYIVGVTNFGTTAAGWTGGVQCAK